MMFDDAFLKFYRFPTLLYDDPIYLQNHLLVCDSENVSSCIILFNPFIILRKPRRPWGQGLMDMKHVFTHRIVLLIVQLSNVIYSEDVH